MTHKNITTMNRRNLLGGMVAAGAAAATSLAVAGTAVQIRSPQIRGSRIDDEGEPQFVAISRETYDAIKAWQEAHMASVKVANAYQDLARAEAIDQTHREALITANTLAASRREQMIHALLREGRHHG